MSLSKQKHIKQLFSKKRRVFRYVAIFCLLAILIDLGPFGGDNVRLYAKWASCGQWPVETVGYFAGEVPSYRSAEPFLIVRGADHYFCNHTEAEQAGYSANPNAYEFPHLHNN